MTRRRIVAFAVLSVLSVLASCVGAVSAHAVEVLPASINEQNVRVAMAGKDDFTKVNVGFTCVAATVSDPADYVAAQSCAGKLQLQISSSDEPKYYREEGWAPLATVDLNAPVGANSVAMSTPDLEATILTAATSNTGSTNRGLRVVHLDASGMSRTLVGDTDDPATGAKYGTLSIGRSSLMTTKCGLPAWSAISTSKAPLRSVTWYVDGIAGGGEFQRRTPETSTTRIISSVTCIAKAPITLKLRGITYSIATGSEFTVQCSKWGNGSVTSKKVSANLWLIQGKVTVTGKPSGSGQYGAGVRVRPGFFGSESGARVNFTVQTGGKMNSSSFFATMRSKAASISAFPLFKSVPSAHCTAGQGVKIRIDGTTTRI